MMAVTTFVAKDTRLAPVGGWARNLLGILPQNFEVLIIEDIIVAKSAFRTMLTTVGS